MIWRKTLAHGKLGSLVSAFFWEGAVSSANTQSSYSLVVANAQYCFMRYQAPFAPKAIIEYRELK